MTEAEDIFFGVCYFFFHLVCTFIAFCFVMLNQECILVIEMIEVIDLIGLIEVMIVTTKIIYFEISGGFFY